MLHGQNIGNYSAIVYRILNLIAIVKKKKNTLIDYFFFLF